jgi:hypothetical protein
MLHAHTSVRGAARVEISGVIATAHGVDFGAWEIFLVVVTSAGRARVHPGAVHRRYRRVTEHHLGPHLTAPDAERE